MKPLTHKQEEDILALAEFYQDRDAVTGLRITHGGTAAAMDWRLERVHDTVRLIKEHPELGMGISVSRGPNPVVTFSTGETGLNGDSVIDVEVVGRKGLLEDILRLVRYLSALKVQHRNTTDKRTAASRRTLNEIRRQKAALSNLQACLDMTSADEEKIAEFIDEVLAA